MPISIILDGEASELMVELSFTIGDVKRMISDSSDTFGSREWLWSTLGSQPLRSSQTWAGIWDLLMPLLRMCSGIPPDDQILTFNGVELKDDRTLADCKVEKNSELQLTDELVQLKAELAAMEAERNKERGAACGCAHGTPCPAKAVTLLRCMRLLHTPQACRSLHLWSASRRLNSMSQVQ